ncbi:MAG: cpaE [Phenylobacterium sp.]|nr:cpaE [Phenylobacterium sp.]
MTSSPLAGRRVLAFGATLAPLAQGPLAGASLELAGLERLAMVSADDADLVLIDADACTGAALAAAVQALAACPNPPPVLLVGERLPTQVVRNLLRLERSDVLEAPFTPEQIAAAVAGLMDQAAHPVRPPAAQAPLASSRCWAVTGAVGGSGATTIAIEIATALCTRQDKEKSVCLIDLNLADGVAAAYLGATPAMRLADIAGGVERIDAAVLQAFVTPITKHLDLLAAPRDPDAFDAIPREAVLKVLEIACESYDWVVLDMPRHRRAWTLAALAGSDEVIVVSELTVPALIAARSLSDEIEAGVGSGLKPRIVLNRLASRMFGPAPSMAEAEKAQQRKAEGGVSSDWEAAATSANLGGPIAQHRPKSKIVKDVQMLVDRLAANPVRREAHAPKASKAA